MRVLLFFLLLIGTLNANHVSWLGNYDKALQKAKKENKPLMVLLVKKESPHCNEIILKGFMNHDYIENINKKLISIIVTYEGESSYPIELFYSSTFPTLFFVNSKDESFLMAPIYY